MNFEVSCQFAIKNYPAISRWP